jgi:hypothetical protein
MGICVGAVAPQLPGGSPQDCTTRAHGQLAVIRVGLVGASPKIFALGKMNSLCGPQHCHRDICRLYKLEPCKVVTEYAMHLEGAKLLKPGTSRLFEEEDTHGIDNSPPESTLTGSETGPKGKQVDRSALSVSNTKVKKPVAPSRKRDLATRSPEKVDPASK